MPKEEIAANGYDLSINKYKETEYVPVEYPSTTEILADLHELEKMCIRDRFSPTAIRVNCTRSS